MIWTQNINPENSTALSALLAAIPILYIFWALIIKRMPGYKASLFTAIIALIVAVLLFKMPWQLAVLSVGHGALYGLFPICWIIISVVFIFNITVKSGQFEIIKDFMMSLTSDRRIQVLLIAFSFGAFLEGAAGFAAPVAITAAMLCAIGFNPFYAAGICLIANTAPVAFGSIGIPITVASQVSGISEMAISQMVGRTLPFISLFLPFYLVVLVSGFKKAVEVLPACACCGLVFAFFQWFCSNYLGPMLPDVIAGISSIIALIVLLKFWKPKTTWRFENELPPVFNTHASKKIFKACSPFIILTLMIIVWGIQPVKEWLDHISLCKFNVPVLHLAIRLNDGTLLPQVFRFNYLSTPGTAMFLAAIISAPLCGLGVREIIKVFGETLKQLKNPVLTIALLLGFAYLTNNSGMSTALAKALANTGFLFPFFSPILGWLGVFITGSDTASNALFGKLQQKTALSIGINPVVTVAANCSGGVVGKMISPQSIAVAAATTGMSGKESQLFRFTVKHSFIMIAVICLIVFLQAYYLKWMVPVSPTGNIKYKTLNLNKSDKEPGKPQWPANSAALYKR